MGRSFPVTFHLHHHQITHHLHQTSHFQKIILHATNHPSQDHTYQMTLIQTPVCHNLLCRTHMTNPNNVVLNEDDICIINVGVQSIATTLLKFAPILQIRLIKYTCNSKVTWFKLDKDPLQFQVYLLNIVNSLKHYLSQFKQNSCCFWIIHI